MKLENYETPESLRKLLERLDFNPPSLSTFETVLSPYTSIKSQISKINSIAENIKNNYDVMVVVSSDGHYLGAKALYDIFSKPNMFPIEFIGYSLGDTLDDLNYIKNKYRDKKIFVNVISYNHSTLETNIMLETLKSNFYMISDKYLTDNDILYTTSSGGAGDNSLNIPNKINAMYSVFTPAGMLVAKLLGIDYEKELKELEESKSSNLISKAKDYAISKFYNKVDDGIDCEIFAVFNSKDEQLSKWVQQFDNEKGITTIPALYSRDLSRVECTCLDKEYLETLCFRDRNESDLYCSTTGNWYDAHNRVLFETIKESRSNLESFKSQSISFETDELFDFMYMIMLASMFSSKLFGTDIQTQPYYRELLNSNLKIKSEKNS